MARPALLYLSESYQVPKLLSRQFWETMKSDGEDGSETAGQSTEV